MKQLAQAADDIIDGKLDTHMPELNHNDEICRLRDSLEEIQGILAHYTEIERKD